MATHLKVLRQRDQADRFVRLQADDSRTAIPTGQADALADELRAAIDGEVRFDKGTRAIYSTDGSNYRQTPIGVVLPRHIDDIVKAVELARKYDAPILNRGGGTSLAGQCCNVAVVIDSSKYMHHIVQLDPQERLARVQPGCVLDTLRDAATQAHGLTFGPDPATHDHCTLGGMLGNNSCGSHSLISKNNGLGLRTSDNVRSLDILLYDGTQLNVGPTPPDELERIIAAGGRKGEIYKKLKDLVDKHGPTIRNKFPKLARCVSGFNLDELLPENGFNVARALVGTESTCVTILEAELLLVPKPKEKTVVMIGFPDIFRAAELALKVLDFKPIACEGMDDLLFEYVKKKGEENASLAMLPPGKGYLLVEFGGDTKAESDKTAREMADMLKQNGVAEEHIKIYDDPKQEEMIWAVREGGLGATAWVPDSPDTWPGWEDSAVPVEVMPQYLRELRQLYDKYNYPASIYGHLAQGCVHCRLQFDLYSTGGIDKYKRFLEEATDLCSKFGGSYSGEHGDGQARGQFLPKMFGPEMVQAFAEFKQIWDPTNKMNPGKVVNPDGPVYRVDENLRIGPDYNPPQPETYFSFAETRNSFARSALRCVGVGKCRREGGGTMCPSYMVTRDERDSTRGRARILFEMMNGQTIDDGWKSEEVKTALDLCLSCKGCKGDCPVNVDMATYKSEFLAHYYQGKLRPRHAYAFGWIHIFSRLASVAPTIANFFTQTPLLRDLSKWMAGVHPKRKVPQFAPQTFKQWFKSHCTKNPAGAPVVLFPDTFNNHFHPDVAIAAVEVLEDAGFRVIVPQADMCCGRPLYDYGFLGMAKRWWTHSLTQLRPYFQAGIPVVILEPSCWAAFKDELVMLFPESEDAKRLRDLSFTFGDFIRDRAKDYRLPKLKRKALLHGHCQQKALDALNDEEIGKLYNEKHLLEQMGLDFKDSEAGCCGMAGAFGYEKENGHYDLSVAAGERSLLPTVRKLDDQQIIIADGFSCQEQVQQQTDRHAMHIAQVMQLALHEGEAGPDGLPEAQMVHRRKMAHWKANVRSAALLAACVAGFWAYHKVTASSDGRRSQKLT